MIQTYQITNKKLPKHFNLYLIGHVLGTNLYIYRMHNKSKECIFIGNVQETLDKLSDKGFIKDATRRKIAKDGELAGVEDRMRTRWKQKRGIGHLIG